MTRTGRRRTLLAVLASVMLVLAVADLTVGPTSIGLKQVLGALADAATWRPAGRQADVVVRELRLPTMLTAVLAGAALGAAGLLMQTFFRNPLAGPDVMGVSGGASLGVALITLAQGGGGFALGAGVGWQLGTLAAASLGALAVLLLALLAARWYDDAVTLLVLGLMLAAAAHGGVGLLVAFAHPDLLHRYIGWTLGSFDGAWRDLPIFAAMIGAGLAAAVMSVKPLNVLQLGPEYARALGLRLQTTRLFVLGTAALLAGATTAVCGPIAFLGVAAPHLARMLFRTSDHRWLLPAGILIGAEMALAVDMAAKSIVSPHMLPINTVSGAFGAPLVIWIVLRRRPSNFQ